jgi:hypothetical protein
MLHWPGTLDVPYYGMVRKPLIFGIKIASVARERKEKPMKRNVPSVALLVLISGFASARADTITFHDTSEEMTRDPTGPCSGAETCGFSVGRPRGTTASVFYEGGIVPLRLVTDSTIGNVLGVLDSSGALSDWLLIEVFDGCFGAFNSCAVSVRMQSDENGIVPEPPFGVSPVCICDGDRVHSKSFRRIVARWNNGSLSI